MSHSWMLSACAAHISAEFNQKKKNNENSWQCFFSDRKKVDSADRRKSICAISVLTHSQVRKVRNPFIRSVMPFINYHERKNRRWQMRISHRRTVKTSYQWNYLLMSFLTIFPIIFFFLHWLWVIELWHSICMSFCTFSVFFLSSIHSSVFCRIQHKTHTHTHPHSQRQCFQSSLCSMLSVRCARVPWLVFFAHPLHDHLTRSSNADMPCVVWSASILRVCIAQRASYVRVQRNRTKYFISDRDMSERRSEGKWVRQANQPSPTSTKG